jgi:hypothetical protein
MPITKENQSPPSEQKEALSDDFLDVGSVPFTPMVSIKSSLVAADILSKVLHSTPQFKAIGLTSVLVEGGLEIKEAVDKWEALTKVATNALTAEAAVECAKSAMARFFYLMPKSPTALLAVKTPMIAAAYTGGILTGYYIMDTYYDIKDILRGQRSFDPTLSYTDTFLPFNIDLHASDKLFFQNRYIQKFNEQVDPTVLYDGMILNGNKKVLSNYLYRNIEQILAADPGSNCLTAQKERLDFLSFTKQYNHFINADAQAKLEDVVTKHILDSLSQPANTPEQQFKKFHLASAFVQYQTTKPYTLSPNFIKKLKEIKKENKGFEDLKRLVGTDAESSRFSTDIHFLEPYLKNPKKLVKLLTKNPNIGNQQKLEQIQKISDIAAITGNIGQIFSAVAGESNDLTQFVSAIPSVLQAYNGITMLRMGSAALEAAKISSLTPWVLMTASFASLFSMMLGRKRSNGFEGYYRAITHAMQELSKQLESVRKENRELFHGMHEWMFNYFGMLVNRIQSFIEIDRINEARGYVQHAVQMESSESIYQWLLTTTNAYAKRIDSILPENSLDIETFRREITKVAESTEQSLRESRNGNSLYSLFQQEDYRANHRTVEFTLHNQPGQIWGFLASYLAELGLTSNTRIINPLEWSMNVDAYIKLLRAGLTQGYEYDKENTEINKFINQANDFIAFSDDYLNGLPQLNTIIQEDLNTLKEIAELVPYSAGLQTLVGSTTPPLPEPTLQRSKRSCEIEFVQYPQFSHYYSHILVITHQTENCTWAPIVDDKNPTSLVGHKFNSVQTLNLVLNGSLQTKCEQDFHTTPFPQKGIPKEFLIADVTGNGRLVYGFNIGSYWSEFIILYCKPNATSDQDCLPLSKADYGYIHMRNAQGELRGLRYCSPSIVPAQIPIEEIHNIKEVLLAFRRQNLGEKYVVLLSSLSTLEKILSNIAILQTALKTSDKEPVKKLEKLIDLPTTSALLAFEDEPYNPDPYKPLPKLKWLKDLIEVATHKLQTIQQRFIELQQKPIVNIAIIDIIQNKIQQLEAIKIARIIPRNVTRATPAVTPPSDSDSSNSVLKSINSTLASLGEKLERTNKEVVELRRELSTCQSGNPHTSQKEFFIIKEDATPAHDLLTGQRLFTYRAFNSKKQEVGAITLYAHPYPCRSEAGDKNNIVSVTGIYAEHFYKELKTATIEDICAALPPTLLERMQKTAIDSGLHGAIRGVSNVLNEALNKCGISKRASRIASQATFYGLFFSSRVASKSYDESNSQSLENNILRSFWETACLATMNVAIDAGSEILGYASDQFRRAGHAMSARVLNKASQWLPFTSIFYQGVPSDAVNTITSLASSTAAQKVVEAVGHYALNRKLSRKE